MNDKETGSLTAENTNKAIHIQREPTMEYTIQEEGIDKFIEKPCIDACKKLWDLNITTFESSGNETSGWIAMPFSKLSEENKKIFKDAIANNKEGYSDSISYKEYDGIVAENMKNEQEVSSKLHELASTFKMQDIQEGVYQSIDDYLAYHCQVCSYAIESDGTIITKFDSTKLEKTPDEYLSENGATYVEGEGRIYINDYYLQKHNNYLDYISKN